MIRHIERMPPSQSPRVELSYTLRRLQKLNDVCGGSKKIKGQSADMDALVDTSKMTDFQKGQYTMALSMKKIRENIAQLDVMERENASTASRAELGNAIRKEIANLKRDAVNVKNFAQAEGKRSEYDTLLMHKNKTEQLFQARFIQDYGTRAALSAAAAGGPNSKSATSELSSLMKGDSVELSAKHSIHDDEEFQLFFVNTKVIDKKIDQALDRIGQGVQRLHENALQVNNELRIQEVLLKDTENKLDRINEQMYTLNGKLRKTLEQVDKDKCCVYLVCCVLLLAVAGYIVYSLGIVKT